MGLDLSLRKTGIAVIQGQVGVHCEDFGIDLKKQSTHRDHIERTFLITKKVMECVKKYEIEYVGIEDYAYSKRSIGTTGLAELGGSIKNQLLCRGILPVILTSGTIRKFLLGKVPKSKQIKKIVMDKLVSIGYPQPGNFDQSDALAIAHLVSKWSIGMSETDYADDVFKAIDFQRMRLGTK